MSIETVTLTTSDGERLSADVIDHPDATSTLVVAHPHPLYGGDRHNHVVEAVWQGAARRGVCSVRFDFRGVGGSTGRHGGGVDERHDVMAAVDHVWSRHPHHPLWLVGYSFGALVVADIDDPRVSGWVLIAPPLGLGSEPRRPACADAPRPTQVVVAQHDEFCPPACIDAQCGTWVATSRHVLPWATHALVAQGSALDEAVAAAMAASSSGPTPQQPPT